MSTKTANNKKPVLLITNTPQDSDWDRQNVVVCPVAGPRTRHIEQAGVAYQDLVTGNWKYSIYNSNRISPEDDPDFVGGSDSDNEDENVKFNDEGMKKKKNAHHDDEDLYGILGLGNLRWKATASQLKKAYRNKCLEHHPDKNVENGGEHDDTMFKLVQKAYDVLSNEKKRKAYDSQDSFDDRIPSASELETDEDFFDVLGPVFDRNARWSVIQPVPELGSDQTPYKQVEKFYDFWRSFKSWREFTYDSEYDIEKAESREERRWMERQNDKKASVLKKKDFARILSLVELAYKRDPRLARYRREIREEKERAKREKEEEKIKREEEKKRLAEEEEAKRKADAEEKRKQKDKDRKALKKYRTKLRDLCTIYNNLVKAEGGKKSGKTMLHDDDVQFVSAKMEKDDLQALCTKLDKAKTSEPEFRQIFEENMSILKGETAAASEKLAQLMQKEQQQQQAASEWTDEELSLLAKGLAKFPGGTSQRWDRIHEGFLPSKTPDQIKDKTTDIRKIGGHVNPTASQIHHFNKFLQQKNQAAPTVEKKKVTSKHLGDDISHNYDASSETATTTTTTTTTPTASATTTTTTTTTPTAGTASTNGTSATTSNSATTTATATSETSASAEWTVAQQKALEVGIKAHKASLSTSWDKIAATVPGKTKEECAARYKYLVALVKSKKQ